MIILLHFNDNEDGAVHIVGVFDSMELARAHVDGLTHPRTGLPVWHRLEEYTADCYWYRDQGDYIVGLPVFHNPTATPMAYIAGQKEFAFPETWSWHTPVYEYGDSEDDDE